MSDIREMPLLPHTMTLGEVEDTVRAFGFELCVRPMEEPNRKQPIGFAHEN